MDSDSELFLISLFVPKLGENVCMQCEMPFLYFTVTLSLLDKAIVNPSVLLLSISKREIS